MCSCRVQGNVDTQSCLYGLVSWFSHCWSFGRGTVRWATVLFDLRVLGFQWLGSLWSHKTIVKVPSQKNRGKVLSHENPLTNYSTRSSLTRLKTRSTSTRTLRNPLVNQFAPYWSRNCKIGLHYGTVNHAQYSLEWRSEWSPNFGKSSCIKMERISKLVWKNHLY